MSETCDPYVWERPSILFNTPIGFTKGDPLNYCMSELINSICMVFLIAVILASFLTVYFKNSHLFVGTLFLATLYLIPTFITLSKVKKEGFQIQQKMLEVEAQEEDSVEGLYDQIGSAAPANATLPTARNPFMNVLIDEIKYAPKRAKAASITDISTKVALDDFFRTEFYSDPTDVFGKTQSQRQFITMPSTSIPNDQDSYQNWLYKIPGKTCKEGGREACLPGTDGGALPWLNADR